MRQFLLFLLFLSPLVGCVGTPVEIKEPVQGSYDVIGPAEGKFGGILLFNFIPIAYNQRMWKAYDIAVKSQGADALIDVTIQDKWYWAGLFNGNVTTVRGTAVKFKDGAGPKADAKTDGNADGKPKEEAPEGPAAAKEPNPPPEDPKKPKIPRRKN